ncbi:MAG: type II toxin-antitoxin system VapC family toxin [Alphaproteobacteria bacterium]|nr:type II toxin-antitoxin system VapC family toxin [Alphaproteobacteria bacterium]
MFLLDSNVVSALRRPAMAPPSLIAWAAAIPVTDLYISAMTIFELELGVCRIERRDRVQGELLRAWLTGHVVAHFRNRILPIDEAVAARCAALHVPDPRPERDSFIAATALVHRLVVVTRNVKDFPDVRTLDPWAAH